MWDDFIKTPETQHYFDNYIDNTHKKHNGKDDNKSNDNYFDNTHGEKENDKTHIGKGDNNNTHSEKENDNTHIGKDDNKSEACKFKDCKFIVFISNLKQSKIRQRMKAHINKHHREATVNTDSTAAGPDDVLVTRESEHSSMGSYSKQHVSTVVDDPKGSGIAEQINADTVVAQIPDKNADYTIIA